MVPYFAMVSSPSLHRSTTFAPSLTASMTWAMASAKGSRCQQLHSKHRSAAGRSDALLQISAAALYFVTTSDCKHRAFTSVILRRPSCGVAPVSRAVPTLLRSSSGCSFS